MIVVVIIFIMIAIFGVGFLWGAQHAEDTGWDEGFDDGWEAYRDSYWDSYQDGMP